MPDYTIQAYSALPQPHTIITQDKQRVFRYAAMLAAMGDYHRVTVTVGGKTYEGDQIRGELP